LRVNNTRANSTEFIKLFSAITQATLANLSLSHVLMLPEQMTPSIDTPHKLCGKAAVPSHKPIN